MKTSIVSYKSPGYSEALKIRKIVFVGEQNVPEEIEVDEFEDSAVHFLATVKDCPAGTGRIRVKNEFIKFERIATLKEFRGLGVGKHLMTVMQDYATHHFPNHTPFMNAQSDAVAFYEKLGWKAQGEEFMEANIAHRAMSLPAQ